MGDMKFINFSEDEVDLIFLVFYKKDSEFKIVEDSVDIPDYVDPPKSRRE